MLKTSQPLQSTNQLSPTWLLVARIVFFLALALCLFFLFYGISPLAESYSRGYIGVYALALENGGIELDVTPGREADLAGIETGDILLTINGNPSATTEDGVYEQLNGMIGEPVTVTVRKADGSELSYKIVRSALFLERVTSAGLAPSTLAVFYIVLSLLVGLAFAVLGVIVIMNRLGTGLAVLASFILLFFPYSVNAANAAYFGAYYSGLDWLYNLLRAAGLFITFYLLLLFPNGVYSPKWIRWIFGVVAIWMVPYCGDLIFQGLLPANLSDITWMVILAIGIGAQVYRYLRVSTETEKKITKPVVIAAFIALGVYVLRYILLNYLLPFDAPLTIWFSLVGEVLVDAALFFFGFSLARAVLKTE